MKLQLRRRTFTENSTIGSLYIDGQFFCYTLEDKDRGLTQSMSLATILLKKIFGKTAIPYGIYSLILSQSNRFKRELPELLKVLGFKGVRFHRGNWAGDTEGCVIVGFKKSADAVFDSTNAEKAIMLKLQEAVRKNEEITLEIIK